MVSGLGNKVCDQTVRNLLKKKGYKFLHSRKKGLLKPKDLKERLKFSRKIEGMFKKNIWTEGISFSLDEVGYQHKYKPVDEAKSVKTMTWQQRSEGLDPEGVERTNSFFRMVVHHKTAERQIMPCTKWVPKNSVYQHGVLTWTPLKICLTM